MSRCCPAVELTGEGRQLRFDGTTATGAKRPWHRVSVSRSKIALRRVQRLVRQCHRAPACKMYILMYTSIMSKSYSVADARAHLPEILDDVVAGKEVELTRRGRPVAIVLSPQKYEALRGERTNFGTAYRAFAERHVPHDIGLEADFFDSLRDRAAGRRVRL